MKNIFKSLPKDDSRLMPFYSSWIGVGLLGLLIYWIND